MNFGSGMRIAAMLRRIAKALEDANRLRREEIERSSVPMKIGRPWKAQFSKTAEEQWRAKTP